MLKTILYKVKSNRIRDLIIRLYKKKENGEMWSETIRELYKQWYDIEIGIGSYGGCFKHENIANGTIVGKYCSFAKDVYIYNANHPLQYITTHPFAYNPSVKFVSEEKISRSKLVIGNDVWVGQNAIILSKCLSIGDGAVIGAGAVITEDIPDYAIVAGVPGRIIGYRFSKEEIESIKKSEWWNRDLDNIRSEILIYQDKERFLNIL